MEQFGFGESSLHKGGESEANNLNFALPVQLDEGASRRVRDLEDPLPGLKGTAGADDFRAILGWMQL
ncbi:MAG: hypothetical protein WAL86_10175 [Candidatus Acidiferrales bacterium]